MQIASDEQIEALEEEAREMMKLADEQDADPEATLHFFKQAPMNISLRSIVEPTIISVLL